LYAILATLAAMGFVASLACHVLSWIPGALDLPQSVMLLHLGMFIVWIPLVIFATRSAPDHKRGNLEHLFAVLPLGARVAAGCLFGYALLNFAYFFYTSSPYPRHHVPFQLTVRGFSGHWMLFYGIAAIGFVALDRLVQKGESSS
jgi:hypothetical protein